VALFFEPFLPGNRIVAAVFQALLDLNEGRAPRPSRALPGEVRAALARLEPPAGGAPRLSPGLVRALGGFCLDIRLRARMNWLTVRLRRLDDKWLFQRDFFTRAARRYEFRAPVIYPLKDDAKRFSEHMRAVIGLSVGGDDASLPSWASSIIEGFDDCLSPESHRDALVEAGIVLEKT
jgi:hypothetical protein